jgi:hypothetical protein
MAAQAAMHASVHARDLRVGAHMLMRVVGARLRGHDVECEDVAATKESYTGQYLRDLLGRRAKGRAEGAQGKNGKRQAAE